MRVSWVVGDAWTVGSLGNAVRFVVSGKVWVGWVVRSVRSSVASIGFAI